MAENKSDFLTLATVDVSDKVEQKNKLDYLSWAWAWAELKKKFPTATATVYENEHGRFWFDDGKTGWVKVGVTVNGLEHIEYLPIMDFRNQSIPADKITSVEANKTYKRALTKCIGLHGLGLSLYAGEDINDDEPVVQPTKPKKGISTANKATTAQVVAQTPAQPIMNHDKDDCSICGKTIEGYTVKDKTGKPTAHYPANTIIEKSLEMYGAPVCMTCMMKRKQAEKLQKEREAELDGVLQEISQEQ